MGDPDAIITAISSPSFFACYLLCSLNPRFKGRTYIGFTVNPKRRIRQHNGEITSGAKKTQKRRPWEMILCVHGFPSNVHALQFEWAWQHPLKSIAVRDAASGLKRRGAHGQVLLLFTMLNLPEWKRMNLVVNFLSTKHQPLMKGCPSLPLQMHVKVGPLDDLPCYRFPYSELSVSADEGEMQEEDESEFDSTEDSCLLQGIQHDGVIHFDARQEAERNVVQEDDNPHQVFAEIDNICTFARRALKDAHKSKHKGGSRKGKPKDCKKDAQKIKKNIGVVSPSKKRGRPKSSKRKSISKEDVCSSLAAEASSLHLEQAEMVATSPSRLEGKEVCDEPQCASLPQMGMMSTKMLQGATCFLEPSPEDLKTPSRCGSKHKVDASVVWDLSPLWSHVNYKADSPPVEESLDDLTTCTPPYCSESKTLGLNEDLSTYPNEGTIVCDVSPYCLEGKTLGLNEDLPTYPNEGTVIDIVSPLRSFTGHLAEASRTEGSERESTPFTALPAVWAEKANRNGSNEKVPAAAGNGSLSQFTPLWSPSPLPAKQDGVESTRHTDALPFKLAEECTSEVNYSFSSPLSCFPVPKCTVSSKAKTGAELNSVEIIDLTDSPSMNYIH